MVLDQIYYYLLMTVLVCVMVAQHTQELFFKPNGSLPFARPFHRNLVGVIFPENPNKIFGFCSPLALALSAIKTPLHR
jgi:hypothetical protein